MKLKAALLVLLVFAGAAGSTAVIFSITTPILPPALRSTVIINDSLIQPLGDPIDNPGFPH